MSMENNVVDKGGEKKEMEPEPKPIEDEKEKVEMGEVKNEDKKENDNKKISESMVKEEEKKEIESEPMEDEKEEVNMEDVKKVDKKEHDGKNITVSIDDKVLEKEEEKKEVEPEPERIENEKEDEEVIEAEQDGEDEKEVKDQVTPQARHEPLEGHAPVANLMDGNSRNGLNTVDAQPPVRVDPAPVANVAVEGEDDDVQFVGVVAGNGNRPPPVQTMASLQADVRRLEDNFHHLQQFLTDFVTRQGHLNYLMEDRMRMLAPNQQRAEVVAEREEAPGVGVGNVQDEVEDVAEPTGPSAKKARKE